MQQPASPQQAAPSTFQSQPVEPPVPDLNMNQSPCMMQRSTLPQPESDPCQPQVIPSLWWKSLIQSLLWFNTTTSWDCQTTKALVTLMLAQRPSLDRKKLLQLPRPWKRLRLKCQWHWWRIWKGYTSAQQRRSLLQRSHSQWLMMESSLAWLLMQWKFGLHFFGNRALTASPSHQLIAWQLQVWQLQAWQLQALQLQVWQHQHLWQHQHQQPRWAWQLSPSC